MDGLHAGILAVALAVLIALAVVIAWSSLKSRKGSTGRVVRRVKAKPHSCWPTLPHELLPGSIWQCSCRRRWIKLNDFEMWERRYWPWPR